VNDLRRGKSPGQQPYKEDEKRDKRAHYGAF
jgi:hypothetical protein